MLAISNQKENNTTPKLSVEFLHFFTGFCLVVCGGISYLTEGLSMMLSWTIFGAMYVSMSDIGEDEMKTTKRSSRRHITRVLFAYAGAILSIILLLDTLITYFKN